MKQIAKCVVVVLALAVAQGAGAEIQRSKQVFPGKLVIGFHPVGFQVGFVSSGPGTPSSGGFAYKLAADVAGLLKDWQAQGIGLYLGGGFNYATTIASCIGCGHMLEIWGFVRLHLNKLNIPLVPWVHAGIAGEVLIYGLGAPVGGGAGFRFGGGLHYWLIKNLGLGFETNFNLGGVAVGNASGFFGYWDILLGARAAF
jgi:hypothetical protein